MSMCSQLLVIFYPWSIYANQLLVQQQNRSLDSNGSDHVLNPIIALIPLSLFYVICLFNNVTSNGIYATQVINVYGLVHFL